MSKNLLPFLATIGTIAGYPDFTGGDLKVFGFSDILFHQTG